MKRKKKFNDLTTDEKNNLTEALYNTASMRDFLQLLDIYFNLSINPGPITKGIISRAIVGKVLPMINPEVNEE